MGALKTERHHLNCMKTAAGSSSRLANIALGMGGVLIQRPEIVTSKLMAPLRRKINGTDRQMFETWRVLDSGCFSHDLKFKN